MTSTAQRGGNRWLLAATLLLAAATGAPAATPVAVPGREAGSGALELDGQRLHVSLVLPFTAFPGIDADGNRIVTRAELQAASPRVAADIARWFAFSDGRRRAGLQGVIVAPEGSDGHAPDGAAAVLVAGYVLFDAPPVRLDAWLQDPAALPSTRLRLSARRRDATGRVTAQVQPLGAGIMHARFLVP